MRLWWVTFQSKRLCRILFLWALQAITFVFIGMSKEEMNPHVTVLTAVRNGAQHVGETIASIQRQTFKDWEYIFVDDASTDDTLSVITEHQRSDPRLRVIRREVSAGPYTAANDGLREALGKYV